MLSDIEAVKRMLDSGKKLVLAGEESLLRRVPKGQWIGGTIPYFMSETGGITTRDRMYVDEIPASATDVRIGIYDTSSIHGIATATPDNGYSILIIPAFSPLHEKYALEALSFDNMFLRVVAGWISGIHLDDLGKASPLVFDGLTGQAMSDQGVAMHIGLPSGLQAQLGVVNIFEPGAGDEIEYGASGFSTTQCIINGTHRGFVDYINEKKLDTRLPLVANYMGTHVNVSIQSLDGGIAKFYAPVFEGVKYHWAKPVGSFPEHFSNAIPAGVTKPVFSCNCILNYLYGELENRKTGRLTGPMTFGEIGYQLLNQTLVYVSVANV